MDNPKNKREDMKQMILAVVISLCTFSGIQAQTIQNGSKWWDGTMLYTASVNNDGTVLMNGEGDDAVDFFQLYKMGTKPGLYGFMSDRPNFGKFRASLNYRVQYIRQEGMYFLAVRNPQGDAVWVFVLTPDNLQNCQGQQKWAAEQPVDGMLRSYLMNTAYLGRFSKKQLRLMRNEILARHGYRFQSKDLQTHFGRQAWYKPGNNNAAIKLSIIEQMNVQLIKNEESVPDADRIIPSYDGELTEGAPTDYIETVMVKNEVEFLTALQSNREVVIAEGVHLNLSAVLENQQNFRGENRRWTNDASAIIGNRPMVISEMETDGRQLVLKNFKNLIIRGEHDASIVVSPRYAHVLSFLDCEDCSVQNLTVGHTEEGYCSGGVLSYTGGRRNVVMDCDLYGCGTYGIITDRTNMLSVYNTIIRDCSYGIMELRSSMSVSFFSCDFFSNREYALVTCIGCEDTVFEDCRFYDNWSESILFSVDNDITLLNCEIYHPTQRLGNQSFIVSPQNNNVFVNTASASNVQKRSVGPN